MIIGLFVSKSPSASPSAEKDLTCDAEKTGEPEIFFTN
jgi:hypothetical protein